eukprot:5657715-Prymnesium_polylepis.2
MRSTVQLLLLIGPCVISEQGGCNDQSVTHEIFSPNGYPEPLIAQTLRDIPREWQQAKQRRVPFEKHHAIGSDDLDSEYHQTQELLNMELSRDPRLQPDDITVTTDHMSACTSCTNYEGLCGVLQALSTSARIGSCLLTTGPSILG